MKACAIVVLAALAGAACGQSREAQQADQLQRSAGQAVEKGAAEAVAKGAEDIGKGVADLASGLSAAFGGDANVSG
jgi:hypothetical protein